VRTELEQNKIVLLPIPPHTSDQIQALDLGIFGVFQLYYKKRVPITTYERQTAPVMKMCDAWQRATIPRNVVQAFRAAGLVPVPGEGKRYYLRFSEEAATLFVRREKRNQQYQLKFPQVSPDGGECHRARSRIPSLIVRQPSGRISRRGKQPAGGVKCRSRHSSSPTREGGIDWTKPSVNSNLVILENFNGFEKTH
jgi:hypothetical protein